MDSQCNDAGRNRDETRSLNAVTISRWKDFGTLLSAIDHQIKHGMSVSIDFEGQCRLKGRPDIARKLVIQEANAEFNGLRVIFCHLAPYDGEILQANGARYFANSRAAATQQARIDDAIARVINDMSSLSLPLKSLEQLAVEHTRTPGTARRVAEMIHLACRNMKILLQPTAVFDGDHPQGSADFITVSVLARKFGRKK